MCLDGSESVKKSYSGIGQDYRRSGCTGKGQRQDQQQFGWQCLAPCNDAHVKARVLWGWQTA